ncbi:ABC transporter ATP-binding protein [Pimelobacter simplex]|uniref:ABC transporter ATP-binding protein n=1 Tax=Nocardioides simplex TaxID=2045 RepID=UPI0036719319
MTARHLHFAYGDQSILDGVDLDVGAGERIALLGPSGSGKSTLLYCLAGILVPTAGEVTFDRVSLGSLSRDARADVRLRSFGFVFQFAELVPELSVRDNVELPLRLLGVGRREYRERAGLLLDQLGIADVADRRPTEVSGGQAQRCAIARAVVHRPRVIFADEPTGALDSGSADRSLDLLVDVSASVGASLVVVTHDPKVADRLDRTVLVADGRLGTLAR